MIANTISLDAHEQPSEHFRRIWKDYAKRKPEDLEKSGDIDDLSLPDKAAEFSLAGAIPASQLAGCFNNFLQDEQGLSARVDQDAPIYYHPLLPGLLIIPSLLPPEVQKVLLCRMIHRDLSNPEHQTNMHLHFRLPYPPAGRSFFSLPPDSPDSPDAPRFEPKDPAVHKPLSVRQVMERKLHWMTLGGQYDWTKRVYPDGGRPPPAFPPDVAALLGGLFPETLAQAAIVNFYTPGDTMMMHRDVSEATDRGLVSLSIGCDGLFMIAPNDDGAGKQQEQQQQQQQQQGGGGEEGEPPAERRRRHLLLRLRSGDAIYMTRDSRFAWHGVPKVVKDTCPEYLADWPAEAGEGEGEYEEWRGWMRNKRINLNVRQMRE